MPCFFKKIGWQSLLHGKMNLNICTLPPEHIVPFGKFHRIGGAPPETFPNVKYDVPEEVGGNRKCFDSPIRK